eukprot:gene16858-biopygen351
MLPPDGSYCGKDANEGLWHSWGMLWGEEERSGNRGASPAAGAVAAEQCRLRAGELLLKALHSNLNPISVMLPVMLPLPVATCWLPSLVLLSQRRRLEEGEEARQLLHDPVAALRRRGSGAAAAPGAAGARRGAADHGHRRRIAHVQ